MLFSEAQIYDLINDSVRSTKIGFLFKSSPALHYIFIFSEEKIKDAVAIGARRKISFSVKVAKQSKSENLE